MTDPVAKKSILATLLADLEAIEQNFHNFADPQLAIAGKMRELLTEAVAAIESTDFAGIGAKVDAALSEIEDALGKFDALKPALAEFESIKARIGSLEALGTRIESLEATVRALSTPAQTPPPQPAAASTETAPKPA